MSMTCSLGQVAYETYVEAQNGTLDGSWPLYSSLPPNVQESWEKAAEAVIAGYMEEVNLGDDTPDIYYLEKEHEKDNS